MNFEYVQYKLRYKTNKQIHVQKITPQSIHTHKKKNDILENRNKKNQSSIFNPSN